MLVQKMQNDKNTHCLVKDFLAVPKMEQGPQGLGMLWRDHIQTNKCLH